MTYVHRIGRTARAGKQGQRGHLRRLGRHPALEADLRRARAAVPRAGRDLLHARRTSTSSSTSPRRRKGTLPRAERTRAGLDAEEIEDLGGRDGARAPAPRRRRRAAAPARRPRHAARARGSAPSAPNGPAAATAPAPAPAAAGRSTATAAPRPTQRPAPKPARRRRGRLGRPHRRRRRGAARVRHVAATRPAAATEHGSVERPERRAAASPRGSDRARTVRIDRVSDVRRRARALPRGDAPRRGSSTTRSSRVVVVAARHVRRRRLVARRGRARHAAHRVPGHRPRSLGPAEPAAARRLAHHATTAAIGSPAVERHGDHLLRAHGQRPRRPHRQADVDVHAHRPRVCTAVQLGRHDDRDLRGARQLRRGHRPDSDTGKRRWTRTLDKDGLPLNGRPTYQVDAVHAHDRPRRRRSTPSTRPTGCDRWTYTPLRLPRSSGPCSARPAR